MILYTLPITQHHAGDSSNVNPALLFFSFLSHITHHKTLKNHNTRISGLYIASFSITGSTKQLPAACYMPKTTNRQARRATPSGPQL